MKNNSHGFTILEVLIALVILSIALSALVVATHRAVRNTLSFESRFFARQVAKNEIYGPFVNRNVGMNGKLFYVSYKISQKTSSIIKITEFVFYKKTPVNQYDNRNDKHKNSIVSLTTFVKKNL